MVVPTMLGVFRTLFRGVGAECLFCWSGSGSRSGTCHRDGGGSLVSRIDGLLGF